MWSDLILYRTFSPFVRFTLYEYRACCTLSTSVIKKFLNLLYRLENANLSCGQIHDTINRRHLPRPSLEKVSTSCHVMPGIYNSSSGRVYVLQVRINIVSNNAFTRRVAHLICPVQFTSSPHVYCVRCVIIARININIFRKEVWVWWIGEKNKGHIDVLMVTETNLDVRFSIIYFLWKAI